MWWVGTGQAKRALASECKQVGLLVSSPENGRRRTNDDALDDHFNAYIENVTI